MNQLSVMKIVYSTSVDGVGLRNSLYVAGCPLRCKGCHNQSSWDINNGTYQDIETVCNQLNIDDFNISILGGEPLFQYDSILALCTMIKAKHPNKTIWMWSGYTFEYIQEFYSDILNYIDVLVDGEYLEQKKEIGLNWIGSSNQRVIDVKKLV